MKRLARYIACAMASGALAVPASEVVIEIDTTNSVSWGDLPDTYQPMIAPGTSSAPAEVSAPDAGTGGVAVIGSPDRPDTWLQCANLVYAGSKSSVCFSPKFLETVSAQSAIRAVNAFVPVKLATRHLYEYPFAVMTGEGVFTLLEEERRNLKDYLLRGGFLLASAGCSCKDWARSFQAEMRRIFPDRELKKIPMDHALFRTLFRIPAISLKKGGTTLLEGLEINGRIVLIYTSEGLNDTANVKGCCCCGGNEIRNSREINANIFTYAVMH